MTASRAQRAPREAARQEAAASTLVQSPPPAPRATPVPSAEQPARPEPSDALARAAVTPTRAVREANAQGADAVVAARPRAQTFSGERARVSAPAPSKPPPPAPEVEVVQRPGLPDLTVIRTSWHPTSDRRSARIRLEAQNELVTLREGDAVGGMVIKEISPSAVIFSAGEVQIRRRVGEASSGR
jgi:hypothetical protein